ncbi:MAG: LemA family protein, partial [Clostridiales bacterium]|nr:LemA family protein [Clostridiales bacterium]
MQTIIIIALVIVILAIWISSVRRKLAVMEETADNNMNQIGVQLSSRFDALLALLELTKGYFEIESAALIEGIKSRRSFINAQSTPDAVLKQESVIS